VKLDLFLIDLFQTGQVTVSQELTDLDADTQDRTLSLLSQYHSIDVLHMPFAAPSFHPGASLWAAKYVYRTLQLVLIRDIDAGELNKLLIDYEGSGTAEEIYSVDLMMRFLPDILMLASGLSPGDPLVYKLKDAAVKWPFSSVGVPGINADCPQTILDHPSLRQAYMDRVIAKKDIGRFGSPNEKMLLEEVMGMHQHQLWPNLNLTLYEKNI
jgi:hypothetical protein